MSSPYFPSKPGDFKNWLANFVSVLTLNAATVGLVAADVTPLDTASGAFGSAYDDYVLKENALSAASGLKKTTHQEAIDILRPLVQRIQHHPGMTDQLRGLLGLPHRDTVQLTAAGAMPPDVPGIFLETEPGTVRVHFGTEPANERINGKPAGVKGCNIWRKKAGESTFRIVAYQSASPYVDTIEGEGTDYTYVAQYRGNKANEVGQSSIQATVAARGALAA